MCCTVTRSLLFEPPAEQATSAAESNARIAMLRAILTKRSSGERVSLDPLNDMPSVRAGGGVVVGYAYVAYFQGEADVAEGGHHAAAGVFALGRGDAIV